MNENFSYDNVNQLFFLLFKELIQLSQITSQKQNNYHEPKHFET